MNTYITILRGEDAREAEPVLAIGDQEITRAVLALIVRMLCDGEDETMDAEEDDMTSDYQGLFRE